MTKRKDTEPLNEYEVQVSFTDTIIGTSENEALNAYVEWLEMHTTSHKVISVKKIGKAW